MNIINKIAKTLLIIYVLFISVFALDVFSKNEPWYKILIGLFIHLVPSFIVILSGIIAWRNEKAGGTILILLGIIFSICLNTITASLLSVCFPLILIGSLFLWKKN